MSEPGPARRGTLADVAARAGVSRATASRALANDPRISIATRGVVQAAAASLRYVPNAAARSLRIRRTRTLGLLLADLGDPVHAQVAAGFELEAGNHGYTVVFVTGSNLPASERRAISVFVEHGTDGIALVSSVLEPREAREIAGAERPLIVVQPDHADSLRNRHAPPDGVIQTDDEGGVEAMVRHLLASGTRRMAYLGSGDRPSNTIRRQTAARLLDVAGVAPLAIVPLPDDAWRRPAEVAAEITTPLPDAILCYDDKLALALLDGLRARGIRVPDDVLVAGFDDIPFAALANPRLTTIAVPTTEIGVLAARALAEAVAIGRLPPGRLLQGELVVRESSQRPPGALATGALPALAASSRTTS